MKICASKVFWVLFGGLYFGGIRGWEKGGKFWRKKPSPDVLTEEISGPVSPIIALVLPEGCKIQERLLTQCARKHHLIQNPPLSPSPETFLVFQGASPARASRW